MWCREGPVESLLAYPDSSFVTVRTICSSIFDAPDVTSHSWVQSTLSTMEKPTVKVLTAFTFSSRKKRTDFRDKVLNFDMRPMCKKCYRRKDFREYLKEGPHL
ncbi:unnamed protein product [Cylicostephanus goldi]|uniref:Uncharacterized protein n=1 Tax=Cylicostephanus goldi TaxID=71465 RepID=A0A3P7NZF9_CYLGO|nr:unnamed protein product [Cylicostephanus goldi]